MSNADSIKTGAPGDEIEVTPAMVEAGRYAFATTRGSLRLWDEDWAVIMSNVFRAMMKARP
jgi:hypothetical protein